MKKLDFEIELIHGCNYRCSKCPHSLLDKNGISYNRKFGKITNEIYEKSIYYANLYARTLRFSFFGEQTINKDFETLIYKIPEKRNYKLIINTNFSTFNKKICDVFVNKFDFIHISLDSVCQDQYLKTQYPIWYSDLDGNIVGSTTYIPYSP